MKKLCILQVTPETPNPEHLKMFSNHKDCDFFFVTHDKENPNALKHCPKTVWAQTRNTLADIVPKNYEYYAFIDYDYGLESRTNLSFVDQLIKDLDQFKPAVLTPYPGNGLATPLAKNLSYLKSRNYSVQLFSHCGMKVVHHSLMRWFFPMVVSFGGWASSHMFNFLEIPFMEHIIMSHNLLYHNTVSKPSTVHNSNPQLSKLNMDRMWLWIRPYFNKRHLLTKTWPNGIPKRIEEHTSAVNSLQIKEYYFNLCNTKHFQPAKSPADVDYFNLKIIEEFYDLRHSYLQLRFNKNYKPNDLLVVIGNGPSLKQEYLDVLKNLKNVDTFGMNSAYRYYDQMDWYPTYFICFDYAVTESHKENWSKMVLNENIPIKKYFFIERPSIESRLNHTNPYFSDEVRKHKNFVEFAHNQDGIGMPKYGTGANKISCTGCNAIRRGIEMWYKKILLIGHDASYQQPEIFKDKIVKDTEWRVHLKGNVDTNPNYFWPDYQRSGDIFHKPGDPLPVWKNFKKLTDEYASDVKIINCSKGSRANFFQMGDFMEEIEPYL